MLGYPRSQAGQQLQRTKIMCLEELANAWFRIWITEDVQSLANASFERHLQRIPTKINGAVIQLRREERFCLPKT